MSYRAYHDDDDDRDVITCVTLSDTRPVVRKEHTCGGCKKTIPVGVRHRRRFMLVDGEPWQGKGRGSISITGGIYGHTSDNTARAAVYGLTDALGL